MPQVTLTFNLPDDESDYDDARLGGKLRCAMSEFYNGSLRKRRKYSEISSKEHKLVEEIIEEFFNALNEYEAGEVL